MQDTIIVDDSNKDFDKLLKNLIEEIKKLNDRIEDTRNKANDGHDLAFALAHYFNCFKKKSKFYEDDDSVKLEMYDMWGFRSQGQNHKKKENPKQVKNERIREIKELTKQKKSITSVEVVKRFEIHRKTVIRYFQEIIKTDKSFGLKISTKKSNQSPYILFVTHNRCTVPYDLELMDELYTKYSK